MAEVVTVDYSMKVPKEGKDIVDFLAAVGSHFLGGKSWAEIGELMAPMMSAIQGAAGSLEEIRSEYKDELAGYTVHKLWGDIDKAIADKKASEVVAPAPAPVPEAPAP